MKNNLVWKEGRTSALCFSNSIFSWQFLCMVQVHTRILWMNNNVTIVTFTGLSLKPTCKISVVSSSVVKGSNFFDLTVQRVFFYFKTCFFNVSCNLYLAQSRIQIKPILTDLKLVLYATDHLLWLLPFNFYLYIQLFIHLWGNVLVLYSENDFWKPFNWVAPVVLEFY